MLENLEFHKTSLIDRIVTKLWFDIIMMYFVVNVYIMRSGESEVRDEKEERPFN